MASTLNEIKAPIKDELVKFEEFFKQSMKSNVALLDKITYYIVQKKGKQMRPMFVFLAAKLCGDITESTYVGASLVELVHTASLVHDDVVDDSSERRGFFSINALWKNKIAVIVGDFLLTQGLHIALENKRYSMLHILSKSVRELAEGELLQLEKARRLDIKEDIYYEIIRKKTASLIASACSIGAASSTEDEEKIALFKKIGEKIGMAFQIKDDLFDYGDVEVGKPRGIDIKEKKMTLPLIYALEKATPAKKKSILNDIKKDSTNPVKVQKIIDYVHTSGGIEYATEVMYKYQNEALALLEEFPDSNSKDSIIKLIKYVTSRKK